MKTTHHRERLRPGQEEGRYRNQTQGDARQRRGEERGSSGRSQSQQQQYVGYGRQDRQFDSPGIRGSRRDYEEDESQRTGRYSYGPPRWEDNEGESPWRGQGQEGDERELRGRYEDDDYRASGLRGRYPEDEFGEGRGREEEREYRQMGHGPRHEDPSRRSMSRGRFEEERQGYRGGMRSSEADYRGSYGDYQRGLDEDRGRMEDRFRGERSRLGGEESRRSGRDREGEYRGERLGGYQDRDDEFRERGRSRDQEGRELEDESDRELRELQSLSGQAENKFSQGENIQEEKENLQKKNKPGSRRSKKQGTKKAQSRS